MFRENVDAARGRGEGGTELRSGAIFLFPFFVYQSDVAAVQRGCRMCKGDVFVDIRARLNVCMNEL